MGDAPGPLRPIGLFAELSAPEALRLREVVQERDYGGGTVISQEGEAWDGLYIVKSGRVKLSKALMGRELTMAIMGPGELLDIGPLFEGGRNVFTARTLRRVCVHYLSARDARAFVTDHPRVQLILLRALNRRIRHLASLASELAFTGVSARVASWVLEQSRARGVRTRRGIAVKRDLSLKELGFLVGTVGRVVSRCLAELRHSGIIEATPDEIVIVNEPRLKAIAQAGTLARCWPTHAAEAGVARGTRLRERG